jgi:hypothetical protein
MSEELRIRIGTPEDLDEIMGLAMMGAEENGFVNPVPARILEDMWPALNLDRGLVGIIGEPGGIAEGAILLRTGKMWYSHDDHRTEAKIRLYERQLGKPAGAFFLYGATTVKGDMKDGHDGRQD